MKPIRVKIVSPNDLLVAGRPMAITCEAWGSFPPAKITWLLDGEPIRNSDVSTHNDNSDVRILNVICAHFHKLTPI